MSKTSWSEFRTDSHLFGNGVPFRRANQQTDSRKGKMVLVRCQICNWRNVSTKTLFFEHWVNKRIQPKISSSQTQMSERVYNLPTLWAGIRIKALNIQHTCLVNLFPYIRLFSIYLHLMEFFFCLFVCLVLRSHRLVMTNLNDLKLLQTAQQSHGHLNSPGNNIAS